MRLASTTASSLISATGIGASRPSRAGSALSKSGLRCWTTTKARPLSDWIAGSIFSSAPRPPADAPIPTTGTARWDGPSACGVRSLGLDLRMTDHAFLLVVVVFCSSGKSVPHQFQDQSRVFLVAARAAFEMIGQRVPVRGALPLRHPAGEGCPLLMRALKRAQHSVDFLALRGKNGVRREGVADVTPEAQHGAILDRPQSAMAFRASEAGDLSEHVVGAHV